MAQPHKTLAECKDEVAMKYGNKSFENMMQEASINFNNTVSLIIQRVDEANKMYYDQFIKKNDSEIESFLAKHNITAQNLIDGYKLSIELSLNELKGEVVNSDVEQAAKDLFKANSYRYYGADVMGIEKFTAIIKSMQSTQQPSITWLTENDVQAESKIGYENNTEGQLNFMLGMKAAQRILKERVNCVDPVEERDDLILKAMHEVCDWVNSEGTDQRVLGEVYNDFIDKLNQLKTKPNGQK